MGSNPTASAASPSAHSRALITALYCPPFCGRYYPVDVLTLRHKAGTLARTADYGAKLVTLNTPDLDGHYADIVMGYDSLDGYRKGNASFISTAPAPR